MGLVNLKNHFNTFLMPPLEENVVNGEILAFPVLLFHSD